ncbi:MAG: M14 family metallopeptidase [Oceanococcus sp.]
MATLKHGLLLTTLLCASQVSSAREAHYTENQSGSDRIALGFAVPQVVTSNSPLAGFRSYDSLISSLSLQALQRSDFTRMQIGSSTQQRSIYAFRFGANEQAVMLQSGGIHAREWASPEAVTGIAEQLLAAADDSGIESYLRDTTSIILIPVLNPDGFLNTQSYPDTTRIGEDPDENLNPATAAAKDLTPREGRMRRKNLRDSDELMSTIENNLLGVDLNRNIGDFWASSNRSSGNASSIVYHGPAKSSEPEIAALITASNWLPSDNLRLFIDTHSFGRVFFYNRTGNERLFNITRNLVNNIRLAPTKSYSQVQENTGLGIGATDEFFAYQRQVPSYTLEIEPGTSQTAEYGGNAGVSHSGFILPEAEVPRMRDEIYNMARLAYYQQAGAAIMQNLKLHQHPENVLVFDANWQGETSRQLSTQQNADLQPGQRYRLQVQFSKPMRWRNEQGQVVAYAGQAAPSLPQISFVSGNQTATLDSSNGRWLDTQYHADSYELEFNLPSELAGASQIHVAARDMAGAALDANPATVVTWSNGAWSNLEDEQGVAGDNGGEDRSIRINIAGTAPNPTPAASGGGSGSLALWLLMSLYFSRRRRYRA